MTVASGVLPREFQKGTRDLVKFQHIELWIYWMSISDLGAQGDTTAVTIPLPPLLFKILMTSVVIYVDFDAFPPH